MTEQLINYAASLFNVPGWDGLEVTGFATLMGVLFGLITLAEILMATYDRKKETRKDENVLLPYVKHTSLGI